MHPDFIFWFCFQLPMRNWSCLSLSFLLSPIVYWCCTTVAWKCDSINEYMHCTQNPKRCTLLWIACNHPFLTIRNYHRFGKVCCLCMCSNWYAAGRHTRDCIQRFQICTAYSIDVSNMLFSKPTLWKELQATSKNNISPVQLSSGWLDVKEPSPSIRLCLICQKTVLHGI